MAPFWGFLFVYREGVKFIDLFSLVLISVKDWEHVSYSIVISDIVLFDFNTLPTYLATTRTIIL